MERATVNPVSLLDLTPEAGIPGDVMRALIDGNSNISLPRHDGLLVDTVNKGIDEEFDGVHAASRST